MSEISKHIIENQQRAENAYWDTYHLFELKKKELQQLQDDVIWMEKDLIKQDIERKYFQKLLNELNGVRICKNE